jgi:RHH-type proline utilization regulon transcriptional repressor/proline dehydrogenase/delta 1-pyrroline-5-carboxylate dehydrogenase
MALFTRSKPSPSTSTPVHTGATVPDGSASAKQLNHSPHVEAITKRIGTELLDAARSHKAGMLSAQFWSDKLMSWSMKDPGFKVQLFRFVDAFPTLTTPQQVHEHLVDYLSQPGVELPPGMALGMKAGGIAKGLMSKTVANQITSMAGKFIAGTNAADALPELRRSWNKGLGFSVDLLGEACVSSAEAEGYREKYLDLVRGLPSAVADWPANEVLDRDHLGPIARANVSVKISSLSALTHSIDHERALSSIMEQLRPILEEAKKLSVHINFDMEQYALKDLTMDLFMRCCEEVDFSAGIAMQAYLRSGDHDATRLVAWSKKTGRVVKVRLVKGAYWDYETIYAEQMGWPVPVWSRKVDTDACFERMTQQFVDAIPTNKDQGGIKLALGSHNMRSVAVGMAMVEERGLPTNAFELQMLRGMADQFKFASVDRGLRVREYVPVGEMIPGMAYLVRRLLENTSNESWLKAGFLDKASPETLLAPPRTPEGPDPGLERLADAPERHRLSVAIPGLGDGRPFFTEPMRDFTVAAVRKKFRAAIASAEVPKVANDGTIEQAKKAVEKAAAAFPEWRDTEPLRRADVLVRAASIMRERRDELAGIIIKENGKPWHDADADVCEAIDFCEYYARQAVPLLQYDRLGQFIGELDQQIYEPRGVAVVISPWNFPLAICAGMTTAALVTGNTTIVKPAEQTPGIAKVLCEILWQAMHEAGVAHNLAKAALQFLPGQGETVGAALVRDPRVALIAFTGSKAVGLDIIKAAAVTPEEQPFIKHVVCEMGGKNAIIIDASADLDEAVLGVRQSAFGFCGQKCSACSRVIVVESAHDAFLKRLVESTASLLVGDPIEPATDMGPVIDEEAAYKIREYIEIGKREGKLELAMEHTQDGAVLVHGTHASTPPPSEGGGRGVGGAHSTYTASNMTDDSTHPLTPSLPGRGNLSGKPFIGPHIFSAIQPHHRLANEEIFGPVLSVMKVRDFDEALRVANATQYKLTGGVFSRKPSNLERARREFRVGNLYLNRGITGALVGRQPFGGFAMSGVGSKAGGRDYLYQFVVPRAICENTMRRGFAPGL